LTFDHTKNVFVFDDDIDVFNPTDILWAIATRVQPHRQVSILQPLFRGNLLDPSLVDEIKTSGMIVDATRPMPWRGSNSRNLSRAKCCSTFPWTVRLIGRNKPKEQIQNLK
jgi:3-polyprenyl-4-hydroxybenzoate decarboxylase